MNAKELELCRWLHDHGVRPEIREGDWLLTPSGPRLVQQIEPGAPDCFIFAGERRLSAGRYPLLLTWKRCREWLRGRGWFLWSHYQFEGPVKIGFYKNPAEHKHDIEGATDLEAILSVMVQIVEGEKR